MSSFETMKPGELSLEPIGPNDAEPKGWGAIDNETTKPSAWERAAGNVDIPSMESPVMINDQGTIDLPGEPLAEVTFDLDRLKEGLTIKRKAYEYAVGKLSEMETNPLKGAFQEEADKSKEGYRDALEEAKSKLKEAMQSSAGDMDKLLRDEYVGIVREIASLNRGAAAEDFSQQQAA